MKKNIFLTVILLAVFFLTACNEGIDKISYVAPGEDTQAPVVSISFPIEGAQIRVVEDVTTINFQTVITDDIELKSIVFKLDGTQIASFSSFKDYRRALENLSYTQLGNGDHAFTVIATDLSGKSTTSTVNFQKVEPYKAKYPGEIFYMPFDGDNMELLSITYPTIVGSPSFTTGKAGKAYAGATDAYLTFPATSLKNTEFSAVLWLNVNTTPDRAGILNISPDGTDDRTKGFRLFREGSATSQTIKLNVGTGSSENWIDMTAVGASDGWKQYAFTISSSETNIYVDGQLVKTVAGGIAWDATCTLMSIGSGMPNFAYWSHLSELSSIDELRIFNKALSASEVLKIYNDQK